MPILRFAEGKRPRTLKTVVKRSIESVMSVSPDDLKRPETKTDERQDTVKQPERSDKKSDLFKNTDITPEERKVPKWKPDPRSVERRDRKERSEKNSGRNF